MAVIIDWINMSYQYDTVLLHVSWHGILKMTVCGDVVVNCVYQQIIIIFYAIFWKGNGNNIYITLEVSRHEI